MLCSELFEEETDQPGEAAGLCVTGYPGAHLAEREGGGGGGLRLERPQQQHRQQTGLPRREPP